MTTLRWLLDLFRPLALLPYFAAKALFTAAALAALVAAARLGGRARLTLVAGALYFPLYLHLERGQIDLFVLVAGLKKFNRKAVS